MSPPGYTTDEMHRFLEELPWWADIPEDRIADSYTFAWWQLSHRLRRAARQIADIAVEDVKRIFGR